MEFPEDILRIIRDYSQPRMKFRKKYRELMLKLGVSHWGNVQKRLCDKDADKVICALQLYTDAYLVLQDLERLYYVTPIHEYVHIHFQVWEQRAKRDVLDRSLRVLLVGEEEVENYERWLRYEITDFD